MSSAENKLSLLKRAANYVKNGVSCVFWVTVGHVLAVELFVQGVHIYCEHRKLCLLSGCKYQYKHGSYAKQNIEYIYRRTACSYLIEVFFDLALGVK